MKGSNLKTAFVFLICICGLCNAVFNLGQYDFFARLSYASTLEFSNPIENAMKIFNSVKSITEWGSLNLQWYEYIPQFFNWIGNIFSTIFDGMIDIVKTLINGLRFSLIMLGWNV